ncbi:hypothetical protein LIER_32970 [Lithospermum erythrorhizon]|uniref:Uncharacterized protein n=1 Tax=Lithospermum erythrorhizon TaxID=34254 RepID=A0AAV3RZ92_LITER
MLTFLYICLHIGSDDHLIEKILNPNYPQGASDTFRDLQNVIKRSNTSAVAWVGEAGGAWNSGQNLVTNSFVFSFWYLDQLGLASSFDTKTYCRQALIGGNYGLLDTTSFVPNPDYYSALLWHRLMGRNVLSTRVSGSDKLRAYAHCSKNYPRITLLFLNLDGKTTFEVNPYVENGISNKTSSAFREEYHLTGEDGNLQSKKVVLNGKTLTVGKAGSIPSLEPVRMKHSHPIIVAPFSIVFVVINIKVPACS